MRTLIYAFCATVLVALAGCAASCPPPAPLPPKVIDTSCVSLPPLTIAASDTDETKREVIAYEIARKKKCSGTHDKHNGASRGAN
jgi:hypothetical protein